MRYRWKKIVSLVAVAIWMAVIFLMSAKPADESTDMSLSVGRFVCRIFIPNYEGLSEEEQTAWAKRIDHPVRKCAHAAEYALLSVLVFVTFVNYAVMGRNRYLFSFLVSALYAAGDEFHQLFVPGRSGRIQDVMIDSGGALAALLLLLAIDRLRKRKER